MLSPRAEARLERVEEDQSRGEPVRDSRKAVGGA